MPPPRKPPADSKSRLQAALVNAFQSPSPRKPVWSGPESSAGNGGITFSMLSRFLVCRERFRVRYVEGLTTAKGFHAAIEYGNMWHACEEVLASGDMDWQQGLKQHCVKMCQKHPLQREEIDKWYNVCKVQFPLYVEYWSKHPDMVERRQVCAEQVFHVPYQLPFGRIVYLRGKWDNVDVIQSNGTRLRLQENKTKSEVDQVALIKQLSMDLQTMLYITTLKCPVKTLPDGAASKVIDKHRGKPVHLLYNVVKRPLSGGAGSIRQHKPTKSNPRGESKEEYFARLKTVLSENLSDTQFLRIEVEVTDSDVAFFREKCLDPILENVCAWYDEVTGLPRRGPVPANWIHPYGIRNVLDEGGVTDVDEYLRTGSTAGLVYSDEMFPELQV